jgi:hypothetical protein
MRKSDESEEEFDLRKLKRTAEFLRLKAELPEAEPLFKQIVEMTKKQFPLDRDRIAEAIETYAGVLRQLGRKDEAKAHKDQAKLLRLGGVVGTEANTQMKSEPEMQQGRAKPGCDSFDGRKKI